MFNKLTACLFSGILLFTFLWSGIPHLAAQSAPDPVVVETAQITPLHEGDVCASGWMAVTGQAYPVYLTTNRALTETAVPDQVGHWSADLPENGRYQVEAYVPALDPVGWPCPPTNPIVNSKTAQYTITHADGETVVIQDQGVTDSQWLDLGVFTFVAGSDVGVMLHNLTGEGTLECTISFSAVRFTRVGDAPSPTQVAPTPDTTATVIATPVPGATIAAPTASATIAAPTASATLVAPTASATNVPPTASATLVAPTASATKVAPTSEPILIGYGDALSTLGVANENFNPNAAGGDAPEPRYTADLLKDDIRIGAIEVDYPPRLGRSEDGRVRVKVVTDDPEISYMITAVFQDVTTQQTYTDTVLLTSDLLDSQLQAPDFTIVPAERPPQTLQPLGSTEWSWVISPRQSGEQLLTLIVTSVTQTDQGLIVSSAPRQVEFAIDVGYPFWYWLCLPFLLLFLLALYLLSRQRVLALAPNRQLLSALIANLDDLFNEDEIREMCTVLGMDYENLGGRGKRARIHEFVLQVNRQKRLSELRELAADRRPSVQWPEVT